MPSDLVNSRPAGARTVEHATATMRLRHPARLVVAVLAGVVAAIVPSSARSIIGFGRRRAVRKTKEGIMSSNIAFGRLVVLVLVVAALGTGTAVASNTPLGLKADGLRLQGIAQMYERLQNGSTVQGLKAEGLRLQGMAQAYQQLQSRPAASFYTPRALKAEGMRWEAMARAYRGHKTASAGLRSSSSSGFDWSAAFIGAASGLGFVSVGVALLFGARRVRRTKVAV